MPSVLKRRREVENVMFVAGAQLQATALAIHASKRPRLVLAADADEDEGIHTFDIDKIVADTFFNYSCGLLGLSTQSTANTSRGPYNQIPRCTEFFHVALTWPDKEFRHTFRMSRKTFDKIVTLLEKNPIFASSGKKPQRPVRFQLATFLMRYSVRGGDAMLAAKQMAVGLGTVFLYCRRVSRALRELGLDVLTWGDDARHAEVSGYIQRNYRFRDCVGMLDGTLIRLTRSPRVMGLVYYCRKKWPALNVQAVVDHEKRFISIDLGWPGSVPDVTVWKRSRLWRRRRDYFQGDQYVLADKGYPSSPYTLRPFTEPELEEAAGADKERRSSFNFLLSSIRIRVEHAFGMLKGRFPALFSLTPADNIDDSYRQIHAMMVLHNLCIDLDDHPTDFLKEMLGEDEEGDWLTSEVDVESELPHYGRADHQFAGVPVHESDEWLREMGRMKREEILNELFPL